MNRRTYREQRSYSAKVMRFRLGVYGHRRTLTPGCMLLLLRLSDDMDQRCIVSVPRAQLADDLDCEPARITKWVDEARKTGFLDVVRRAQPKVTAVYCGLIVSPAGVRPSAPQRPESRGAPQVTPEGCSPAHLSTGGQRCAGEGSQEEAPTAGTVAARSGDARDSRTNEQDRGPRSWPADSRSAERESAG